MKPLLSQLEIESLVKQAASAIGPEIVCITPVMDGGMIFACDLLRHLNPRCRLSSTPPINEREAWWVVDNTIASGRTLAALRYRWGNRFKTAVLFGLGDANSRRIKPDFLGRELGSVAVVGYGGDIGGGQGRGYHDLWEVGWHP